MCLKRFYLLLAALLITSGSYAASVEERSPFRQGHWWDPSRSGHGFELLNAGDNVFAVWYTYDAMGQPVWYTAQGTVPTLGSSWPLLKHWWNGERIAESTRVGSLRLSVNHFESLSAAWELGASQGSWTLEPFVQSGVINEVDLSGHWFNPSNSGWGMTLVDQGDVFGAVIYAYDTTGAPTWVAGFDRGNGTTVTMRRYHGPCPSCTPRAVINQPAGSIEIGYRGDSEITVKSALTVPLAVGVRIEGAQGRQLGRPASTRRADYQLAPFRTERSLKTFLAAGINNRAFYGAGADFSAPPPSAGPTSFSVTNVQVEGVDEADLVKTDGRYLYSLSPLGGTHAAPTRKVRIAELGADGSSLTPVGELSLAVASSSYSEAGLYLHSRNLVTLVTGYYRGGWYYSAPPTAETHVEFHSIVNPVAPMSRYSAKLPGTMVSSRRIGDRLYVVTRFTPDVPGILAYPYTEAMRTANREAVEAAPLTALLPWISENGRASTPVVGPMSVFAPQYGANQPVADMVVVNVFDVREARFMQALAIVGRTDSMFVSQDAIYLASTRYGSQPQANSLTMPLQPSLNNTDIHQIRLEATGLRFAATGTVEGYVGWGEKAAFRFGDVQGRLGVVSSINNSWWGSTRNRVTLLEPSTVSPGLLKTVSWLPNARRPEPLGKPNEILFATRFVGNKLYAVTFQRVDPLYTVDLSDASDPRITGELQVPGFSDYLHPLPNGLLLGFGRDATANGLMQGLHLTLFDVNGAAPRELQRVSIGQRGSDSPVFGSHRAMSILPRADGTTVVAFPAAIHDGPATFWGSYQWQWSGLLRFEVRGHGAADAQLVHTQTLKTAVAPGPASPPPTHAEYSYGYGRSVLFPNASIYAGERLWRQDAAGNVSGPF